MTDGPQPRGRLRHLLAGLGLAALARRRRPRGRRRPGVPPPAVEREVGSPPWAERATLLALAGATLAAVAFIVFYVAVPDTQLLGLAFGLAFVFLAIAAIVAGKQIVPQEKVAEEYEELGDDELVAEVHGILRQGGEGISRRGLLVTGAGVAGATVGAAALVPAASLGPRVGDRIARTPWKAGRRLVDAEGTPIAADDIDENTFHTAFPEGASRRRLDTPIIVVRISEDEIDVGDERRAGMPEGIVAFSKICPHAGCAISMYRSPLHEPTSPERALVCPCHFSTFEVRTGGRLLFGPAGRDLPQLPLRINATRHLEAAGDFFDQVGPSYGGIRKDGLEQ